MENPFPHNPLTVQAIEYYERELKHRLEPEHNGKGIALHPATGDYEIAKSPSEAGLALWERHPTDTVTFRIGPPTTGDLILAERMLASKMR